MDNFVTPFDTENIAKRNIMKNFSNAEEITNSITKAISEEEFQTKYSTGYEVFTAKQVLSYVKDIEKAMSENIEKSDVETLKTQQKDELSSLERVCVIKGEKPFLFFVRPTTYTVADAVKTEEEIVE